MKREKWIILLSLLLLLVTSGVLAQSGSGYDVEWQTIGSGSVQLASGGNYKIGFTVGQDTPPLISSGGNYIVVQGYGPDAGASLTAFRQTYLPLVVRQFQ